jgi:4-alpha-glucanotransferase
MLLIFKDLKKVLSLFSVITRLDRAIQRKDWIIRSSRIMTAIGTKFAMNMHYYDDLINELSDMCGILPEYWDIFGKKHITAIDTQKAILGAMKLKIESAEDAAKEIHDQRWKSWKSFLEPVHVVSVNFRPLTMPVYIPVKDGEEAKLTITWTIEDENNPPFNPSHPPLKLRGGEGGVMSKGGEGGFSGKDILKTTHIIAGKDIHISEQQWIDGTRYIKVNLNIGQRDIGYYVLDVACHHPNKIFPGKSDKFQKKSKIIITPDTCYILPKLQDKKAWGLSFNLYAIRTEQNWGIGDFADLKRIVGWISDLKGSLVGINPLHAIPNTKPFGVSPYSPISRLYKNFIYLDVEKIPEVHESENAGRIMESKKFRNKLDELRKPDLIEYEKVALVKEKILRNAFDVFYENHFSKNTQRGNDFRKYRDQEGIALESFALFMALWEHMKKTKKAYAWQEWPEKYHEISGKAVVEFRKEKKKEILFHQYIQWLIDGQLREISEEAEHSGMSIGLYYDLAIGAVAGGSDAWSFQDIIADGADVGAPPDDFSPEGQKWGFPPLLPEQLRESGYELFIRTIRTNMKYGGAIRIDHALGLFRLFWIPEGMTPKDGAYVTYPSEDLLRIIALESVRNKTMVIAEDLGTISENARETLKRFHMLSYRLFYFERNYPDPSFLSPDRYPDMALCAVTTHDLPTIYGYWTGRDLETRKQLGKFSDDAIWQQQVHDRERDKGLILASLKSQGIVPADYPSKPGMIPEMTPELCLAIYRYLSLTPCKLLLVSLDDIIGTMNQQNMPGIVDAYPNWMQKTPLSLEEMMRDKRFDDLYEMLKERIALK